MPLPRTLVYNDLSGDEVKHILIERFSALLNDIPYLQKHITLPRVRMQLSVTLDCWADQPNPERRVIDDSVELRSENAPVSEPNAHDHRSAVIDASRKGDPPDKIREDHGLGVPTPTRGPESWRSVAIEDHVEGRVMTLPNGAIVDRTGQSPDARANSTVVKQDFGPAREGRRTITKIEPPRGPVAPPNWNNKEE
jgi:hypothetical protein